MSIKEFKVTKKTNVCTEKFTLAEALCWKLLQQAKCSCAWGWIIGTIDPEDVPTVRHLLQQMAEVAYHDDPTMRNQIGDKAVELLLITHY